MYHVCIVSVARKNDAERCRAATLACQDHCTVEAGSKSKSKTDVHVCILVFQKVLCWRSGEDTYNLYSIVYSSLGSLR